MIMTREEILQDPWVSVHYGDPRHPNYLNPDLEAGVDYGEEKMIEKAFDWLQRELVIATENVENIKEFHTIVARRYNDMNAFIEGFKKAMES